jgi:hypothetical protein
MAAYSMYLQLPSIAVGHLLHLPPQSVACCGDKGPILTRNNFKKYAFILPSSEKTFSYTAILFHVLYNSETT